jgi:hypothetical protein
MAQIENDPLINVRYIMPFREFTVLRRDFAGNFDVRWSNGYTACLTKEFVDDWCQRLPPDAAS